MTSTIKETKRILENQTGEPPLTTGLKISVQKIARPAIQLHQVSEVVAAIANTEGKSLTDEEWKDTLPSWFVESMINRKITEIKANENLWHFGSWIDAIKQRGWKWWSSCVKQNSFDIYLESLTYPYNIDPFIYIVYSTGIEREDITIDELL